MIEDHCFPITYIINHVNLPTHTDPDLTAKNLPFAYKAPKDIVVEFVNEVIEHVERLIAGLPFMRICLVLDGEPLHAKKATHKKRSRHSYSFLKQARKFTNLYLARPADNTARGKFIDKFKKCAFGWVRWFGPLKKLIVSELMVRGFVDGFSSDGDNKFTVVTAAFEADPTCIAIAHCAPHSAILSNDGDLLVYPYADNSPVCHSTSQIAAHSCIYHTH